LYGFITTIFTHKCRLPRIWGW